MDAIEAIHTRRSIRAYTERPVDRPLIEHLIWDAAQAPPPFAGQVPWTFNIVQGAGLIAAYGERARRYARDHRPEGPGWAWIDREDFDIFWGAPVLVVISGPVEDCCRAAQTLLLAAHARGLGACWVGSPMLWLRTDEAKAELGVPPHLTPISAICLGCAAQVPEPQTRAKPVVIWRGPL